MFIMRRRERKEGEKLCERRYRAVAGIRRAFFVSIVLHASQTSAIQPAWRGEAMHYFAQDTPLPEVLKAVANAGGLQVKIASGIKDPVNGSFDEPPANVFAKLIDAFGLAWYFDGQMIHVSAATDIKSRTIPFAPMKRHDVVNLLSNLGLDDSHLPIRYSETTAVVSGPSGYVNAIADAVAHARRQAAPSPVTGTTVIRVFPLRYAQAQDITYRSGNQEKTVPGVASLLRKLMADVTATMPGQTAVTTYREPTNTMAPLPRLRGLGLSAATSTPDMPLPDTDVIRTTAAPMQRNIVADARTNSVVIYDVPSMMRNYERTIAMLDKPQDLVEITAAVIDVSSEAANELGIRWGGQARGHGGAVSANVDASPPHDATISPLMPGVNLATMIGNSANYLFAKIRMLEQSGKARILSRPQVLTLNNTEAVLSSQNSFYVRVAGNQDVDLYNVDTGLTLKVTPTVESSLPTGPKNILLSVQIEDGAFDSSVTVDGIPKVNRNSIVTQAVIRDGESLLVGGYEYERSQQSGSEVPALGDIPLIGALFRGSASQYERQERLILITPRIKSMTTIAANSPNTQTVQTKPGELPPLPGQMPRRRSVKGNKNQ